MRRFAFALAASCLVPILVPEASAQVPTYADQVWWHYRLTQAQRDANILRAALSVPDGTNVGVECKEWVRRVVKSASHNVVTVPPTTATQWWVWQWNPDVEAVATDRWDGVPWPPGQILQAEVRTKTGGTVPHTMVVVSADRYRVTVIESNWNGDTIVRRRTALWPDFQRNVVHYTLYRVK